MNRFVLSQGLRMQLALVAFSEGGAGIDSRGDDVSVVRHEVFAESSREGVA